MMDGIPAATPVTFPLTSTVAIDVEPEVQVPPGVLSIRETVLPTQNAEASAIIAGRGFTVTTDEVEQPKTV